ncbi:hypothetical protein [Portibacter marinus]|uniref:hypothetical protein n=1 Tax=Portibacter marinus TaxID=2898660 RepID=UPI001F41285E|nr:hypothetical protein [Portibacter marinus]
MTTTKSKQTTIAWLITGMIIFAGLAGYLWFDRSQLAKANVEQQEQIAEKERVQAELEIQYEEAMTNLDAMKTDNVQLNELIEEQKLELADQKKKISGLLWTQGKLKEAREEIANLTALSEQYVAEIQTLKDENVQLNAKNVKLEEDKTMLIDNLNVAKEDNEELQVAQAKLMSEKEELEEVKSELEAKVNVASVINVENVVAQGLKTKNNGKEVARQYAKQVEKMRICFDTEENMVAEKGQEIFYVRIIDPQGETMAIESAGSGVLTNDASGEDVRFSKKGVLNYENKEVTACVDWAPGTAFPKGNYEVEVYNKGYLAGKGAVQLK